MEAGFERSNVDPCFFYYLKHGIICFIVTHVDNCNVATNNTKWIKNVFESFEKHDFKFTMERPNSILGVVIDYDRKRRKVVFNMIEYIHKLKTLYKNYVGENPISVYVPIKDEVLMQLERPIS